MKLISGSGDDVRLGPYDASSLSFSWFALLSSCEEVFYLLYT